MIVVGVTDLDQLAASGHQGPWTWSLVNTADGTVWSPQAKAFLGGDKAADGVRPLALVSGPQHIGQAVACDASIPDPGPSDVWMADVHDSQGRVALQVPVGHPRPGNASVALAIHLGN